MMRIDPYYIDRFIDSVFRGAPIPADTFSGIGHLALLKNEPQFVVEGEPGSEYWGIRFNEEDEVSYSGYARQSVQTSNLTTWRSTQGNTDASSGTSGETGPVNNIFFPLCTTSNEVVNYLGLCYDSELNSTYVIAYWTLDRPFSLSNSSPGIYPCVPSSLLTLRIDD